MPKTSEPRRLLETRRLGLALVTATMTAWSVIFIAILGPAYLQSASGPDTLWTLTLLVAFIGIPMALVVCFLGGVPILVLADWLKLRKWWHAILLGAAAGVAFAVCWAPNFVFVLVFAVAGIAAGFAAWLVLKGELSSA